MNQASRALKDTSRPPRHMLFFLCMHVCRKARESIYELQHELECSRDREVAVHKQLASTVMQAEKAITEKNSFAKIV